MLKDKKDLILSELVDGTGAIIEVEESSKGLRTGINIWFGDLSRNHGPIIELRNHGLKSHKVRLYFGIFSKPIIDQISVAPAEDQFLARSLIASIRPDADINIRDQSLTDWSIKDSSFCIDVILRHENYIEEEKAILDTCRDVIIPIMAAMAELIGYDEVVSHEPIGAMEGAIKQADVLRRERNPRNRLLCLRIHGDRCACCLMDPSDLYGKFGNILEVHHIQPLSQLDKPREYDPATDLAPLCPNCHRAVHTRSPTPWSLDELRQILNKK